MECGILAEDTALYFGGPTVRQAITQDLDLRGAKYVRLFHSVGLVLKHFKERLFLNKERGAVLTKTGGGISPSGLEFPALGWQILGDLWDGA